MQKAEQAISTIFSIRSNKPISFKGVFMSIFDLSFFSMQGAHNLLRFIHIASSFALVGTMIAEYFFNKSATTNGASRLNDKSPQSIASGGGLSSASKYIQTFSLVTIATGLIYFFIKSYYLGYSAELFITPWWIFLMLGSMISLSFVFNILLIHGSIKFFSKFIKPLGAGQIKNLSTLNSIYILPLLFCMINASHLYIEVARGFRGWLLYLVIAILLCVIEYMAIQQKWDFLKYHSLILGLGLAVGIELLTEIIAKFA